MKINLRELKTQNPFSILQRIEFWVATGLFALAVIAVFSEEATESGSLFGLYYLYDLLIFTVFYISFLLLNFLVIPKIGYKKGRWINTAIIAVIIAASFALFPQVERNFILIILAGYFLLKFGLTAVWEKLWAFREEKGNFYTGILLAAVFYLILMVLLLVGNAEKFAIGLPGILIPYAVFLYSYSYQNLIPASLKKRYPFRNYLWKVVLVLLATAVPLAILGYLLLQDEEIPFLINIFNLILSLFVTVPLAWYTFQRHKRGSEEIITLRKELGQSTAQFDFLRSQINPHFLFNALNTLYGTALQEKAERTGEGIQQLGDMMRFMLHENIQEKISLAREIEYLENYINLQRLRTDVSPSIAIQAEIQHQFDHAMISPMLLIPFVENAFKHGISFREPSHIKIALEKKEESVFFDVYNSKHLKKDNDPERDKSGIGLTNVKQRLELLYPDKHELVIKENTKEFFVHLRLELN